MDDALHRLELIISHLLRAGVLLAGVFLLVGWLWLWSNNGDLLQTFQTYHPESLATSFNRAVASHDHAMLVSMAGLTILVLLPLTRVAMTGALFVKQKDFMLALMAFLVFATLIGSFFLGIEL